MIYIYCLTLSFLFIFPAQAFVFEKNGNIYKDTTQLTFKHRDESPILSPNKQFIAFIRNGKHVIPENCLDFSDVSGIYGKQLWIYDLKNKAEKLLVDNNFSCHTPIERMISPEQLHFSPNSQTIYFITSAWVVSGAVHAVNVDGSFYRYINAANHLEIIYTGDYQGHLVLQQHRYHYVKNSDDDFWLYTSEGKEVARLGKDIPSPLKKYISNKQFQ